MHPVPKVADKEQIQPVLSRVISKLPNANNCLKMKYILKNGCYQ